MKKISLLTYSQHKSYLHQESDIWIIHNIDVSNLQIKPWILDGDGN
jgi:hypothetical protein